MAKVTKKVTELSDKAKEILVVLQGADKGLTLQEITSKGVVKPNGSHLKALENRNLVTSVDVEIIVPTTRTVKSYSVVVAEEETPAE